MAHLRSHQSVCPNCGREVACKNGQVKKTGLRISAPHILRCESCGENQIREILLQDERGILVGIEPACPFSGSGTVLMQN